MDTGGKMFKKIINPNEELSYKLNSVDTRYLINEGDKSIGVFAATKDLSVPTQISPQNICFFVTEGEIQITVDDKVFDIKVEDFYKKISILVIGHIKLTLSIVSHRTKAGDKLNILKSV